jgi:trehalose 6-phosphate synthase
VRAYPASVDPGLLRETMQSEPVAAARERLAPGMKGKTIIRVDRVDPSKNQVVGFLAFERLLELRPDLRKELRFLAFLVPSRTDLGVYKAYTEAIYERIEIINKRFEADCGEPPVKVFYTNDQGQALAAMEACDVLLVNSLEDGMNLVAKEWAVVSQRPGALIVSETAGVATEAQDAALQVSPLDVEGTAKAMAEALDMPVAERERRLALLRERIDGWTARNWLDSQLADLGVATGEPTAV